MSKKQCYLKVWSSFNEIGKPGDHFIHFSWLLGALISSIVCIAVWSTVCLTFWRLEKTVVASKGINRSGYKWRISGMLVGCVVCLLFFFSFIIWVFLANMVKIKATFCLIGCSTYAGYKQIFFSFFFIFKHVKRSYWLHYTKCMSEGGTVDVSPQVSNSIFPCLLNLRK